MKQELTGWSEGLQQDRKAAMWCQVRDGKKLCNTGASI
jgi:hypothetical protein